jgi:hypothetical protein
VVLQYIRLAESSEKHMTLMARLFIPSSRLPFPSGTKLSKRWFHRLGAALGLFALTVYGQQTNLAVVVRHAPNTDSGRFWTSDVLRGFQGSHKHCTNPCTEEQTRLAVSAQVARLIDRGRFSIFNGRVCRHGQEGSCSGTCWVQGCT